MRRRSRELPPILTTAQLQADTADPESRTVDLRFYSGAPVFRLPLFDDPHELEFEMTERAAQLDRLNAGAPLVDNHATYEGVKAILGVVEKAWLEDGEGRARVRFSSREDVAPVFQDVLDGVIRNVSMGTYIHEMEEVTRKGAKLQRFRATSWQPYEISLVGIPADPGAQILHGDDAGRPCQITFRAEALADAQQEGAMELIKVRLLADSELGDTGEIVEIDETTFDAKLHSKDLDPKRKTDTPAQAARKVDAALADDQTHTKEIQRVADHFGLDRLWAQRHINMGNSIDCVIEDAKEQRAQRAPREMAALGFGNDYENAHYRVERMGDALAARIGRKAPPEEAREFAEMSFVECAHECLSFYGRHRNLHPRRNASEIVEMALHTTSDFPLLLGNVMNKLLLPAYESAMPTYRQLAQRRTFNDFRPHRFLRSGDFPVPLQVNEHGEYKYGTMSENQETVTLVTYGRIIGFSRQSLVNDDLGAFEDLAMKAAIRTADFENATFFSTCITAAAGLGPNLSDGNSVFHAAHANLTGAGALDVTRLGEARQYMMAQTSLDGIKLNIPASILLVSPASLTLAEQLTSSIQPQVATNVNPFAGRLTPVGDANLTGTRFYVLADPMRLANYVYGSLGGQMGPRTEARQGFEIDGVEFKLSLDFAVGAIDYRGAVTGAGA